MAKIPVATYNTNGVGVSIVEGELIQLSIYDIIPNDNWLEDREGRAINLSIKSAKTIADTLLVLSNHLENMNTLKRSL